MKKIIYFEVNQTKIVSIVNALLTSLPVEEIIELQHLKGKNVDLYISKKIYPQALIAAEQIDDNTDNRSLIAGEICLLLREQVNPFFYKQKEKSFAL